MSQQNNSFCHWIICEDAPRWAVLLRRYCPQLKFEEARSPALLRDMLESPQALQVGVLFVIPSAWQASCLQAVHALRTQFPHVRWMGLFGHSPPYAEIVAYQEAGLGRILHGHRYLKQLSKILAQP